MNNEDDLYEYEIDVDQVFRTRYTVLARNAKEAVTNADFKRAVLEGPEPELVDVLDLKIVRKTPVNNKEEDNNGRWFCY